MEPIIIGGVMFASVGGYLLVFPDHSRNWVSPEEWQRQPAAAAEKQRDFARAMAAAVFVMGLCLLLAGALFL